MPNWLDGEGRAEWKRIVPALGSAGVLAVVDRALLAMLCQTWSDYHQATHELRKSGSVTKERNGVGKVMERLSPWVKIQQDGAKTYNRLAGEFGLSSSSRASLKVGKAPTPLATKSRENRLLD